MARRPNLNGCVFCDPEPCECGKKPKKAAIPRPRKPEPEPTPKVEPEPAKPSALEAMRQAAQVDQLRRKRELAEPVVSIAERSMTADDAVTLQALRSLSEHFELSGSDLDKYKEALSKPATTTERSLAWKERRRQQ